MGFRGCDLVATEEFYPPENGTLTTPCFGGLLPRKLTFCSQSHGALVQMIFLFKQVIFRCKMLVFGGVTPVLVDYITPFILLEKHRF